MQVTVCSQSQRVHPSPRESADRSESTSQLKKTQAKWLSCGSAPARKMITDISLVPLQLPEVGVNGYTGFKPGAQEIIKKGSTRPGWSEGETTAPLACDIIYQRDIEIRVRDGARLYADIFRSVLSLLMPCVR